MEQPPIAETPNPCITCGACCAFFRCSFYWRETEEGGGTVPDQLTEDLTEHRKVMRGTDARNPRCIALMGDIGDRVYCAIYDRRSTTCRIFIPSWENGEHNPDCDRARAAHGLRPLTPSDWESPTESPDSTPTTPPDTVLPAA